MPETKATRPGRSNSFQRMLELERQYMLERLQASTPQSANPPPFKYPASTPPRSAASASIQTRRAEIRLPKTPADARRGGPSPAKRPAPLIINTGAVTGTSTSTARPRHEAAAPLNQHRETPAMKGASTAAADKPSPKVVSFEFPPKEPDQRSICVSPSWEAHGRRKKEKKMMEKKEKEEEAAKKADGKGRKGRLSKQPPPASSTDALKKVEDAVPDSTGPRGRQKERPSTAAAPKSPSKDGAPRKTRSRSSSFASLIRSPFEFRRSSVGHAPEPEPEFIGGIKLELERHLANERALNEQAKADGAPGPPREQPNHRWSAPLRSPPPPARGPADARDVNRRAYPPITRHSNAFKTRSLVSPTAPSIPDLSKIDRWRARVGLRPTSQPDQPSTDKPSTDKPFTEKAEHVEHVEAGGNASGLPNRGSKTDDGSAENTNDTTAPPNSRVATQESTMETERPLTEQPSHVAYAQESQKTGGDNKEGQDLNRSESVPSSPGCRSGPSNGYGTAPSTPPPDPPRRSPKRTSLHSLNGSITHPHSTTEATEALMFSIHSDLPVTPVPTTPKLEGKADALSTNSLTPKAADLSNIKITFPSPSRATVPRSTSSHLLRPVETRLSSQVSSSTHLRPLPTSSSEDSCSEELHSPSPPSTPATSRPQSEKGMPLLNNSDKGLLVDSTMAKSHPDGGNDAAKGAEATDDEDTDDIQAAADKVLASFCEVTEDSAGLETRRNSDSNVVAGQSFLPMVPKHQPLRLIDKGTVPQMARAAAAAAGSQPWRNPLSREHSPRPAPATYLEEARRGIPAAPLSRSSKQRLGPPASFVLPGDPTSPLAYSETSRSSDTVGRCLRHTSTPSLGQLEREPVAKVFVECCGCRFFHDMPSNLYEAMANPGGVLSGRDTLGYAGSISMTVKCPWCKHEMSTKCCAGLAAMVYVTERLH